MNATSGKPIYTRCVTHFGDRRGHVIKHGLRAAGADFNPFKRIEKTIKREKEKENKSLTCYFYLYFFLSFSLYIFLPFFLSFFYFTFTFFPSLPVLSLPLLSYSYFFLLILREFHNKYVQKMKYIHFFPKRLSDKVIGLYL